MGIMAKKSKAERMADMKMSFVIAICPLFLCMFFLLIELQRVGQLPLSSGSRNSGRAGDERHLSDPLPSFQQTDSCDGKNRRSDGAVLAVMSGISGLCRVD